MFIRRYFIGVGVCIILFVLGLAIAAIFFRQFLWQPSNPFYRILKSLELRIIPIGIIVTLLASMGVATYLIGKYVRYFDELIRATEQITAYPEHPVILSKELQAFQDELNALRNQTLLNIRQAKEAEQRKHDLIMYLAHDLKTPLTSVIGYLNLLAEEQQLSPELRRKYQNIALNKAVRLEELINEFFEITRFNLTNLALAQERVHFTRMLEQITSEFLPVMQEKNLTWQLNLMPEVYLLCDIDKMQRVLDNLIRNAIGYSYENTAIMLSLTADISQNQVILQICNHGKTIAPEKLVHIFEPFYRTDTARSSRTGGAGLGLAIAKEIVEKHGGRIYAHSSQERVEFTIYLPMGQ